MEARREVFRPRVHEQLRVASVEPLPGRPLDRVVLVSGEGGFAELGGAVAEINMSRETREQWLISYPQGALEWLGEYARRFKDEQGRAVTITWIIDRLVLAYQDWCLALAAAAETFARSGLVYIDFDDERRRLSIRTVGPGETVESARVGLWIDMTGKRWVELASPDGVSQHAVAQAVVRGWGR